MKDSNKPMEGPPQPGLRGLELRIEGILYRLHGFRGCSLPKFLRQHVRRRGVLKPDYFIRVGARGPELVFLLNRTLGGCKDPALPDADGLISDMSASEIPAVGCPDIREVESTIPAAKRSTGVWNHIWNEYRPAVLAIVCMLAVLVFYSGWGRKGAAAFDQNPPVQLETRQAVGGEDYFQIGRLINKLVYSGGGMQVFALHSAEQDRVEQDIASLMKEFGAEEYSVPPAFVREVMRFIKQYQGRDRELISKVLVNEKPKMEQVRRILRRDNLPEDLAYMVLVESSFMQVSESQQGAAGFWQFTESTAREYGMEVSDDVDERLDLSKSTEAASRYIRDLILDFGSGSSVMLAIAAYNTGAETVRRAVRNVKDPIKQRNFWYLYSTQALPAETLEYVPKVIATILIGRAPERFGF